MTRIKLIKRITKTWNKTGNKTKVTIKETP